MLSRLRIVWLPREQPNQLNVPARFSGGSDSKASVYTVGDLGSIPGSGRSAGEGNGNPLQYYCLENPMDRGVWQVTVHGVAKSRTCLSDFTTGDWYLIPPEKSIKSVFEMHVKTLSLKE